MKDKQLFSCRNTGQLLKVSDNTEYSKMPSLFKRYQNTNSIKPVVLSFFQELDRAAKYKSCLETMLSTEFSLALFLAACSVLSKFITYWVDVLQEQTNLPTSQPINFPLKLLTSQLTGKHIQAFFKKCFPNKNKTKAKLSSNSFKRNWFFYCCSWVLREYVHKQDNELVSI